MKLPLRLPLGLIRFWRGCRVEEKLILGATALIVPFCGGFEYSKARVRPSLPPLFRAAPDEKTTPSRSTSGFLWVHVAGKVRRPGVQKLVQGARVFQALQAAGGATDDKSAQNLNLAEVLRDGQKIVVGQQQTTTLQAAALPQSSTRLAPDAASSALGTAPKTGIKVNRTARKALPTSPINLNTATVAELEKLPGVGPALAARIVAAREQKRFGTLSDLDAVSGIGPKKLEAMQPFVTF